MILSTYKLCLPITVCSFLWVHLALIWTYSFYDPNHFEWELCFFSKRQENDQDGVVPPLPIHLPLHSLLLLQLSLWSYLRVHTWLHSQYLKKTILFWIIKLSLVLWHLHLYYHLLHKLLNIPCLLGPKLECATQNMHSFMLLTRFQHSLNPSLLPNAILDGSLLWNKNWLPLLPTRRGPLSHKNPIWMLLVVNGFTKPNYNLMALLCVSRQDS